MSSAWRRPRLCHGERGGSGPGDRFPNACVVWRYTRACRRCDATPRLLHAPVIDGSRGRGKPHRAERFVVCAGIVWDFVVSAHQVTRLADRRLGLGVPGLVRRAAGETTFRVAWTVTKLVLTSGGGIRPSALGARAGHPGCSVPARREPTSRYLAQWPWGCVPPWCVRSGAGSAVANSLGNLNRPPKRVLAAPPAAAPGPPRAVLRSSSAALLTAAAQENLAWSYLRTGTTRWFGPVTSYNACNGYAGSRAAAERCHPHRS